MTLIAYPTGTTTNGITCGFTSTNRNNAINIQVPNSTSLPAFVKGTSYDLVYQDDTGKTIGNETKVTFNTVTYLLSEVNSVATYQNIGLQFNLS